MRPWRTRLALRRSRTQWALLSVVLLVALLASTLMATLFLLADATETFAARTTLTEADDADVRLVVRVAPDDDLQTVIEAPSAAVDAYFGDVPYARSVHTESDLLSLPDDSGQRTLTYLASMDGVAKHVTITAGDLPGRGEVLVPHAVAERRGLEPGDALEIAGVFGIDEHASVTVSGTYAVSSPGADFWRLDRFQGAAHNPATPLPFSGGRIVVDGYGPLLTDHETIARYPVGTASLTYLPDFSAVSTAQAEALIERTESLDRETIAAVGTAGDDVRVTTRLDVTLGGVVGSLAVTRSSVLVTGLLLLVLAVAALAQTARLMSERRHAEQSLMVARGASGRQLLGLALIEACVVGAITATASPGLAWAAYGLLASQPAMTRAGMDRDPGIPVATWAVSAIVALVTVVVMVAPLLRRSASFIDAESAQARPKRASAVQRGGIDVALLALAGLAYWQLRSYESPVIADSAVARVDPLLAAGPALALLAGALVAVRLIPAASRALEGLAARGRRAVMPLAAWEVGRRPARAVSAVLLLTLAISIGAFSLSYLASWTRSQEDQARYRHPADAVVTGLAGDAASQSAEAGDAAAPALHRTATITTQLDEGFGEDELQGRDVRLIASTQGGLAVYVEGRSGAEGAAAIPQALAPVPVQARQTIPLPDAADGLAMTVTPSTSETVLTDIFVSLRAVVTTGSGELETLDLGILAVDGEEHRIEAAFAETAALADLDRPYALAGLQSVWLSTAGDTVDAAAVSAEGALTLELSVDQVAALEFVSATPVDGVAPVFAARAVDTEMSAPWFAVERNVQATSLDPDEDQLHVEMITSATALRFRPASLVQTAWPVADALPVVLTRSLASRLSLDPGDSARIGVDGAAVTVAVADVVSLLPSDAPRQEALVADLGALQLALVQAGAATAQPDQWWIDIEDEAIEAYAQGLPDGATLTSRVGVATSLKEDPLRVATQAALWLVTAAAVVLAAVGFAVHAVVTVRARTLEFAQLRAVGVSRGQLLRVVAGESVLLTGLGLTFGLGLGIALSYLVAPLVAVGADGRPPLPSVTVEIPWATLTLLAIEAVAVVMVAVAIVGSLLRRIDPAGTLRTADA